MSFGPKWVIGLPDSDKIVNKMPCVGLSWRCTSTKMLIHDPGLLCMLPEVSPCCFVISLNYILYVSLRRSRSTVYSDKMIKLICSKRIWMDLAGLLKFGYDSRFWKKKHTLPNPDLPCWFNSAAQTHQKTNSKNKRKKISISNQHLLGRNEEKPCYDW